jgi:hypothetical protein
MRWRVTIHSRCSSRGWMTSPDATAKHTWIDCTRQSLPTNVHQHRRDMTSQQRGVSSNQPRHDGDCERIFEPRLNPIISCASYRSQRHGFPIPRQNNWFKTTHVELQRSEKHADRKKCCFKYASRRQMFMHKENVLHKRNATRHLNHVIRKHADLFLE